jgi:putative inorganic carbon (HCO3(-)) transporter
LKHKQTPDPKPAPPPTQLYDRLLSLLLYLLAFLVPLKFGLPNLDVASPVLPEDLARIVPNTADFLSAVFTFRLRTALNVIANALSTPWPEEIAQILIVLALFLWGVKSLSQRRLILRVGKSDLMMWLLVLVGFITTLFSPAVHSSFVVWRQFLSYALLYFLIVHAVDSSVRQQRIIRYVLISSSVVALLGLYQFALGFEEQARAVREQIVPHLQDAYLARLARGRVYSVFVYPNSFAGFLLAVLPLVLFYGFIHRVWFTKGNLQKGIVYILLLPLPCILSFFLTQSKAGYLTLFLVAVAAVIAARRKIRLRPGILLTGLIALIVILSAILLTPPGRRLILEKGGYTFEARIAYWRAGLKMIPRNPIIGSGFNSFGLLYSRYQLPGPHEAKSAHNNYLQILVETGILGFICFLGVWVFGLAAGFRHVRKYLASENRLSSADALVLSGLLGVACFLIHGFADFDLYVPGIAMTIWLCLGLIARNAPSFKERTLQLTERWKTGLTVSLTLACAFIAYLSAKTLNANAHFAVADAALRQTDPPPTLGDYEDAIREMKKALWWDGGSQNLHVVLGRIYSRLGRYDDAVREYATADRLLNGLSAGIAHDIARAKLARMSRVGEVRWKEILSHFRDAVTRSPVSPFRRLVYAYYLSQAGHDRESREQLRKLRQLDPSGKEALRATGMLSPDDPLITELKQFLDGSF